MAIWDREAANFIIKDVTARADAFRKFMREQDVGIPIGQENVDDEAWALFYESELKKFPIIPLINTKTEQVFAASPFLLALELSDGGREVTKRYARIRGFDKGAS